MEYFKINLDNPEKHDTRQFCGKTEDAKAATKRNHSGATCQTVPGASKMFTCVNCPAVCVKALRCMRGHLYARIKLYVQPMVHGLERFLLDVNIQIGQLTRAEATSWLPGPPGLSVSLIYLQSIRLPREYAEQKRGAFG